MRAELVAEGALHLTPERLEGRTVEELGSREGGTGRDEEIEHLTRRLDLELLPPLLDVRARADSGQESARELAKVGEARRERVGERDRPQVKEAVAGATP